MSEIVVSAPARLHFGMLDPAGLGARRFGGFGVGVEAPRVVVGVRRAGSRPGREVVVPGSQAGQEIAVAGPQADQEIAVAGPQADRAMTFARRSRSAFELRSGVEVTVHEAIPRHVGLGSGTKLGLAIARGMAGLAGVTAGPGRLAEASGRGARSSVGCWTFAAPGLVVEAGVPDEDSISPVVARHPMPPRWRCVLAMPTGAEGLSGAAEERCFDELGAGEPREPSVSRLLLTELLPGLLSGDIAEFGAALTAIQREVGSMFAVQQGGIYHPRAAPVVQALLELGVGAVGQSSWGPAVYGIVDGPDRAAEVADRLRAAVDAGTEVSMVDFDRRGARAGRGASVAALTG